MSDWEYVQIGSICDVGDGAHTKVSRQKIGIPYLTSKNFSKGALKLDDVDYISEDDYENLFSKASKAITRPQKNDVLMMSWCRLGFCFIYRRLVRRQGQCLRKLESSMGR